MLKCSNALTVACVCPRIRAGRRLQKGLSPIHTHTTRTTRYDTTRHDKNVSNTHNMTDIGKTATTVVVLYNAHLSTR